ncbi:MAG: amino acid transporter, partial [Bradymonadia bacterium]
DPLPFFMVFAICFPAFTGMTAGVGLSGDLKDPKTSIPRGTLLATVVGMLVYVAIVFKLAYSAPVDQLASNQLVMADIALWGPMILIGLGAATLSSAIGSVLVAPRTLQALCADGAIPIGRLNPFLASGSGAANEPRNATIVTGILALGIAAAGNVDFVARLISMFFMVTYGALCAISFLEHFAAQPSYRPSFRSRWYISLFGAIMCLFMMLQMDPIYAISSILMMIALYSVIVRQRKGATDDLAAMFEGVLTQATRQMHVRLQQQERSSRQTWRPSVIMVSGDTFNRSGPLTFLGWLCHRHGFGTYLHFIKGHLGRETVARSVAVKQRLLSLMQRQRGGVYVDTIISPSMISALAQSLQLPGVSGLANNTAVFEFSTHDDQDARHELLAGCRFAASMDMALIVLRHGDNHFGQRRQIDVWLTWNDAENANVMILLSYIVLGHSDWSEGEIRVNVAMPSDAIDARREEFQRFLASGRLPISEKNLRFFEVNELAAYRSLVALESQDADLTVVGFDLDGLEERGDALFTNHPSCKDVIFVHSREAVQIE